MADAPRKRYQPRGLQILHEDRDIIVVAKDSGLLTVAVSDGREARTAYSALTEYVKKGQTRSKKRIFIVHRLDRDTSGILVFAKTEDAKRNLQQQWDLAQKTYLAIVDGHPQEDQQNPIISYLAETTAFRVFSTDDPKAGKRSETHFKVLKPIGKERSLLEVKILTGRKHQIRVHLSDIGHPIVGDVKYGTRIHGTRTLALHAQKLTFTHPFTEKELTFEAPVPPNFYGLGGLIADKSKPAKLDKDQKIQQKKSRRPKR